LCYRLHSRCASLVSADVEFSHMAAVCNRPGFLWVRDAFLLACLLACCDWLKRGGELTRAAVLVSWADWCRRLSATK
jgi:hypothetical protein